MKDNGHDKHINNENMREKSNQFYNYDVYSVGGGLYKRD